YEQDEFQVKTPTDVIGQHIHLVKFDVTSSDGSGNGWNYEDGTFSPEEVHERVVAIQAPQGEWIGDSPTPDCELGNFARNEGGCIQTTVQRWWADPIVNDSGDDRTLRTVFTHDHFGPSTHQHPGLYAGLVIEPFNSTWVHNETGDPLGGRGDGGPTTWEAVILTDNPEESYREFLLEMGDFSLAYRNDEMRSPVNPPAKVEVGLPNLLEVAPQCPGGVDRPCPEAISADDPATMTVNYRNEPIALRVHNPRAGQQTSGEGGDLSFAFESRTDRAIGNLNAASGGPYPPLTEDLLNGDPFTPMLKAYEGDKVQVRILMGAQEEGHNFGMNGAKWLLEPSWENSGYKNSQILGISEHFEFELNALTAVKGSFKYFDSLYAGHAIDDLWNGLWGIMRVYNGGYFKKKPAEAPRLFKLPQNPDGKSPPPIKIGRGKTSTFSMNGVCPSNAPVRNFTIHAVLAQNVLPGGTIIYNEDEGIHDPGAILFVRDEDLDGNTLREGVPVEPLILRANAGDCIHVKLVNDLPGDLAGSQHHGFSTLPMIVEEFNNNHILPSGHVSLQPQLLEFDRLADVGLNIGQNVNNWGVATVPPGGTRTYKWYAGRAIKTVDGDGKTVMTAKPAEYGVVNLMSSDWIKHASKGAVGALVIEPPCSVWDEDGDSDDMRASADIYHDDGCEYSDSPESNYATIEGGDGVFGANDNKLFRELVVVMQDDLNLLDSSGAPIPNLAEAEDPEDSGQKGINYRTEPLWTRTGFPADHPLEMTRDYSEFENILSSSEFGDPATPVFTADAGEAVRFRVVKPGGHARNSTFALHGHGWQQLPWINGSTLLGTNSLSEWKGSESGIGPGSHLNFLLSNGAGGYGGSAGDYLFRDQASFNFDGGLWGIFRVQ
ncbi:MAG: copper oxidase, partial [Gammaproteobacteria bacterium]